VSEMSENNRTHEPNLRELCAELDGFKDLMDERDRRYGEKFLAAEKAVSAALAASEKAAEKTESALKEYKTGANEWRDTVKDLIGNLREARSGSIGERRQHKEDKQQSLWVIGLVVVICASVAEIVVKLLIK
jgi:hypothetical protein